MKFNILDPTDRKPLLLHVVPTEHEGTQALKVIFPEKDSITMIKKNGVRLNAIDTDISPELVKAISKGIHSHIHENMQQTQHNDKSTVMKNILSILLLLMIAAITIVGCGSNDTSRNADSVATDSARIDTSNNPVGGLPDTAKLSPDTLQIDTL